MTDLTGRTVLITGGNSGIGKWTAIGLARMGADVVITSRDLERGTSAAEDIRAHTGSGSVQVERLDLADFTDIRRFAEAFTRTHPRLDVLVNNAGLTLSERAESVDGNEMLLQTNHLGPFLLTNLLLPLLEQSAPARIVNVASTAHKQAGALDLEDLQTENRRYIGLQAYARTKLMNILFTRELARRLAGRGVTANALHPGTVRTGFGMGGDARGWLRVGMILARPFFKSPRQGARASIFLASSPRVADATGGYYVGHRRRRPSAAARDDALAARLWERSTDLVGLHE